MLYQTVSPHATLLSLKKCVILYCRNILSVIPHYTIMHHTLLCYINYIMLY